MLRLEAQQRKKEGLLQRAEEQRRLEENSTVFQSPESGDDVTEHSSLQGCDPGSGAQLDSLTVHKLPTAEQHLVPQVLDTSGIKGRIVSLSCGSQHLMALTSHGAVYTWGRDVD